MGIDIAGGTGGAGGTAIGVVSEESGVKQDNAREQSARILRINPANKSYGLALLSVIVIIPSNITLRPCPIGPAESFCVQFLTSFLPLNFHCKGEVKRVVVYRKGMSMAHVLQQGLWGKRILHSEHL